MSYTPGPWVNHGRSAHLIKAGDEEICQAYMINAPNGWEQRRANALLIAAAPDLLEALYDARGWFQIDGAGAKTRSKIDAAIAKAEGRA